MACILDVSQKLLCQVIIHPLAVCAGLSTLVLKRLSFMNNMNENNQKDSKCSSKHSWVGRSAFK